MKLYKFEVPQPSAKRLKAEVKFITHCVGFGCAENIYTIQPDHSEIFWHGPDELVHHEWETLDANYRYLFFVEYNNTTGSRKETFQIYPEEFLAGSAEHHYFIPDAPSQENFYG